MTKIQNANPVWVTRSAGVPAAPSFARGMRRLLDIEI